MEWTRDRLLVWVVASCGLMLLGAFGPWAKVLGLSVSGTDGSNDGWAIAVIAAIVAVLVYRFRESRRAAGVVALIGGGIASALTIADRSDITDAADEGGALGSALVQVGWGLTLAMLASISLVVAGGAWLLRGRADASDEQQPLRAPE